MVGICFNVTGVSGFVCEFVDAGIPHAPETVGLLIHADPNVEGVIVAEGETSPRVAVGCAMIADGNLNSVAQCIASGGNAK